VQYENAGMITEITKLKYKQLELLLL